MIRGRTKIKQRRGVQVRAQLRRDRLARARRRPATRRSRAPTLFNGFSLFYLRDTPLMSPRPVLGLDPEPDFLLYQ